LHFLANMRMKTARLLFSGERGFSLLEVVVAAGIVTGAFAALAQLLAMSIANNVSARGASAATVLAVQKMEQLRALPWDALTSGDDVDYLDPGGGLLGEGGARPPGAVYVRRWSVQPVGGAEGLALQVRVNEAARLVTIRTKRAP
jgi:type II secretory pathway pseudopilin PulG